MMRAAGINSLIPKGSDLRRTGSDEEEETSPEGGTGSGFGRTFSDDAARRKDDTAEDDPCASGSDFAGDVAGMDSILADEKNIDIGPKR